jgi:hypothetical protein
MKYFAVAASLFAAVKAASLGNTNYDTIAAGESFAINWYGAKGKVTLDLRNGASTDLKQLITITSVQSSDDGTGSFTWTVPSSFASEGPYAIVITDDSGVNYSPQFPIAGATVDEETKPTDKPTDTETTTTAPTTTAPTTTAAPSTTVKSTFSAEALKPSSTVTFEFQSSSSVVPTTSAHGSSTTLATTKTGTTTKATPSSAPSTVPDGEGKAAGMASPLALILVSVAAMFYLQ